MKAIFRFEKEYAFLSNFHPSPFVYEEETWATIEHAFQAQKTLNDGERELIRVARTPLKAKQLGRKVGLLRPDWEDVKEWIMLELVRKKFIQNPGLGAQLLATGNAELVEGNDWHDNGWGNCFCQSCECIEGRNRLGIILMQVRNELKAECPLPFSGEARP